MSADWIGAAETDVAGEWTKLLEGTSLLHFPEGADHSHECPECRQLWAHSDEACQEDAVPDPWYRGLPSGGYALCGDCDHPGSNGSLWKFCSRCGAQTLADPAGRPGCCGGTR